MILDNPYLWVLSFMGYLFLFYLYLNIACFLIFSNFIPKLAQYEAYILLPVPLIIGVSYFILHLKRRTFFHLQSIRTNHRLIIDQISKQIQPYLEGV